MYGRRNPVLRHFGADELATQGTLRAIEERRSRGEFVAPVETIISRPTPEFDDFFEFDRPVSSGLAPNARDLLLNEASSSTPTRAVPAAYSQGIVTPGDYSPEAEPSSPVQSPPPGSYDSSPSVAYQAAGPADGSGGSGGGGGGGSPLHSYPHSLDRSPQDSYGDPYGYRNDRHSGGGSPGSGTSPARSSGSRGTTSPRRSYDQGGPAIRQPPFRTGTPGSGSARPPGVTGRSSEAAAGRRRSSSSPDAARSPSPSAQPSSEPPGVSEQQQTSASDVASSRDTGPGAAGQATVTPRRGLGAKISGRPPAVASPRGPGGAAGRRSLATSPRPPAGPRAGPGGGTIWGAGPGRNAARVTPAWAPATGIGNMRLEDEDDATRVALMLNDPSVRDSGGPRPGGAPRPSPRGRLDAAAAGAPSGLPSPPPPDGPGARGGSASPGGYGGRTTRPSDVSEHYYDQYRLRRHRESDGVPDFRFSQPRSHGAHAPLQQKYFSFDEAHPALAEQHYVRSPAQERALQAERRKLQQERNRAALAEARSRLASPSPMPTAQQLAAEVERLERVREAGRARLRELEQEGDSLRQETRQVQRRALEAIARSEQMSAATSRSPSPAPTSPGLALPRTARARSRSPSAHFYSSRTSGTFGTPPPLPGGYGYGYGSQSSRSPGRFRPASASPQGAYQQPGAGAGGGEYGAISPSLPYISGQGQAAGVQRPVSAPPRSQGGALAAHGSDEAQEVLEMLNSADRLPQHEQIPLDDSGGGSASYDDPLQRAASVASSRRDLGLLGPDEQRIAMGVYDRSRYEEYQRQVDLEMQRRAVEGGYDSDLERDDAAAVLVEDKERVAAEEEARRQEEEARRAREDAWMDEYRQRLGPEDGYLPQRAHSASGGGRVGPSSPPGLAAQGTVLSDAEEVLVQGPYVPVVSPELTLSPAGGYASEGADGQSPHRRTRRRLFFKSTVPEPFQFEERERMRPKPIATVKLEQDLALRKAEEEAARKYRFHAKAVPTAVVEPRYEQLVLEAEAKRQLNQNQRLEELAAMMERPFSFYYRDKMREEEREALARAAKDPNRFQLPFQARGVPQSIKEDRFHAMMMEMEAKREATRRRVEEARQAARERVAQEAANRRQAAERSYRERLRAVDPALHPYGPKPLGLVPDFNTLHRHNEVSMARARANMRKHVTVPHEFALNGSTPEEQAARARKAEERRQRIILDMQVDSELLPEARWPYKSPRGKVRRNAPPPFLVEYMANATGQKPSSARKAAERAEKEATDRRVYEKQRAEALHRAEKILEKARQKRMKDAAEAGGGGDFGLASDVAATAAGGADQGSASAAADRRSAALRRRESAAARDGSPGVYVEARHAQVEQKVRNLVEDVLLETGIESYRYVEGLAGDEAGKKKGHLGK